MNCIYLIYCEIYIIVMKYFNAILACHYVTY